jgi:spore coat protein CotH
VWTTFALALFVRFVLVHESPPPPPRQQVFFQPGFRHSPTVTRAPVSEVPKDLPRLHIEIAPKDVDVLRGYFWNGWRGHRAERPEVLATVREGNMVYTNVTLHLKGAAGSFRPFDDKPALTLNFNKNAHGQRFHNYSKISLNNSVQDPTYLCEALCRELYEKAGVPAPQASWATVMINTRDLGLYVMLEGANKDFLKRHFKNVKGNLYDGGFCQEVNPNLDVNSGDNPDDHSDLRRLLAAVSDPDVNNRWTRLNQVLDMDRFVTSLAIEVIMCHWDGYAMNRNNYRLYHDLDHDRMIFIPHGMDQMFGLPQWEHRFPPEGSIQPGMKGAFARAVMANSIGREMYYARMQQLMTNLFQEDRLLARVHEMDGRIRPTLAAYDPNLARQHDALVATLCQFITRRVQHITEELNRPKEPLSFDASGTAPLTNWVFQSQSGNLKFDRAAEEGKILLHTSALNGSGSGSWRMPVLVPNGRYRFEGRVRSSSPNVRVALRVSGQRLPGTVLTGTDWEPMNFAFSIDEVLSETVLVCEFTGARGEAWYDLDSLRLVRE